MNKSYICSIKFCCKFRQLHFCQTLFKLVLISHCYHESLRGELFLKHSVVITGMGEYKFSCRYRGLLNWTCLTAYRGQSWSFGRQTKGNSMLSQIWWWLPILFSVRPVLNTANSPFLQRVSIACYAERCISYRKSVRHSVRLSVCLSVTRWHCVKTAQATIMGPNDSSFLMVNFSAKFQREPRERGRRMRQE